MNASGKIGAQRSARTTGLIVESNVSERSKMFGNTSPFLHYTKGSLQGPKNTVHFSQNSASILKLLCPTSIFRCKKSCRTCRMVYWPCRMNCRLVRAEFQLRSSKIRVSKAAVNRRTPDASRNLSEQRVSRQSRHGGRVRRFSTAFEKVNDRTLMVLGNAFFT